MENKQAFAEPEKQQEYTEGITETIHKVIKDEPLANAMSRWKDTLFYHDFSNDFTNYFQRVNAFNGYRAGEHNAYGFRHDTIGQICGAIGQLKSTLMSAQIEGRNINEREMERTKQQLLKAAEMRGNSASELTKSNHTVYLASIHTEEQAQIVLLAENVPSIIEVIREINKPGT